MKDELKVFKALSDKNRLRIVKMLEVKPMCVCEITMALSLAPSTVSKHLSVLTEAGHIADVKDGKWVNYSLAQKTSPFVRDISRLIRRSFVDDIEIEFYMTMAKKIDRSDICK